MRSHQESPSGKGHLVLIGGAEEKRGDRRILRRTLELGGSERVTVVPTASRIPARVGRRYVKAFRGLGAKDVQVLDIRRARDADQAEHLERIAGSDVIFFSGGDQTRLTQVFGDSEFLAEVRRSLEGGATIAGTSAGATAAGDPMIYDGQEFGLRKGRVRHEPGFGFLPGVAVDTHFVSRGRYRRLAQFLASGECDRGIGLSENTALVVAPDLTATVVGAGPVVVLSAEGMSYTNFETVGWDEPVSMAGLELGFLSDGAVFDLSRWSVAGNGGTA